MLYCDYLNRLSLVQRAGTGFVPVECTDASRGSGHALLGRRQCKHLTYALQLTWSAILCRQIKNTALEASVAFINQSISFISGTKPIEKRRKKLDLTEISGFLCTGLCWKLMAVARETYSPDPLVGHEMGCRGKEGKYEGANRDG